MKQLKITLFGYRLLVLFEKKSKQSNYVVKDPYARAILSSIEGAFSKHKFGESKYYAQPQLGTENLANNIVYSLINNFPPIITNVKDKTIDMETKSDLIKPSTLRMNVFNNLVDANKEKHKISFKMKGLFMYISELSDSTNHYSLMKPFYLSDLSNRVGSPKKMIIDYMEVFKSMGAIQNFFTTENKELVIVCFNPDKK